RLAQDGGWLDGATLRHHSATSRVYEVRLEFRMQAVSAAEWAASQSVVTNGDGVGTGSDPAAPVSPDPVVPVPGAPPRPPNPDRP
ncbi:MAG: hypothetical protein SNJ74_06830, partial [Fimbriimonadaceae bacterium]